MEMGIGRSIEVENLCPVLVFAIARERLDIAQTMHRGQKAAGDVASPA